MRTIDPAGMAPAERIAEIGDILAAGFQRLVASQRKASHAGQNLDNRLADAGAAEAQCGRSTRNPA